MCFQKVYSSRRTGQTQQQFKRNVGSAAIDILLSAVLLRTESLTSSYVQDDISPEVPKRQIEIAASFLEEKNPNEVCFFVLLFLDFF